mgnify:FL=1
MLLYCSLLFLLVSTIPNNMPPIEEQRLKSMTIINLIESLSVPERNFLGRVSKSDNNRVITIKYNNYNYLGTCWFLEFKAFYIYLKSKWDNSKIVISKDISIYLLTLFNKFTKYLGGYMNIDSGKHLIKMVDSPNDVPLQDYLNAWGEFLKDFYSPSEENKFNRKNYLFYTLADNFQDCYFFDNKTKMIRIKPSPDCIPFNIDDKKFDVKSYTVKEILKTVIFISKKLAIECKIINQHILNCLGEKDSSDIFMTFHKNQ